MDAFSSARKHWFGLSYRHVISFYDTMKLSSKQIKTVGAIFEEPIRSDVEWTDIENLLRGLGAELSEGRGSRVRVISQRGPSCFSSSSSAKRDEQGGAQVSEAISDRSGYRVTGVESC